jgi:predicted metal-dependent phosphoesterase TrpH
MLKADFHIHTNASKCSVLKPAELIKCARARGLDVIAVTDHNTLAGYEAVKKISRGKIYVIKGIEISTPEGEILILNPGRVYKGNIVEVCEAAHDDNAIIIAPHPFDIMRKSLGKNINHISKYLSLVEVFNARAIFNSFNAKAQKFAEEKKIRGVANSDSHTIYEIGNVWNSFDCDADDVLEYLRRGKFEMHFKSSPVWVHGVAKTMKVLKFLNGALGRI